jgi:hypothetical protein
MNKLKFLLINAFIVMHLMMMCRAQWPIDKSKILSWIYTPVTFVQSFFSMYQGWEMFAPNPSRLNIFLDAEIEFEDGTTYVWQLPRATHQGAMAKHLWGEKMRKLVSECLRMDKNSWAWKDTARYVLRKNKETLFEKNPMKVHLRRNWYNIDDLDKKFIPHGTTFETYEQFKFYTFDIFGD